MKLIYISNSIDSAFNSQVAELLKFMVTKLDSVTLIVASKKNELIKIKGVDVYYFKRLPDYPLTEYYNTYALSKVLKKLKPDKNTIIHTRGSLPAYYILKLKNKFPAIKILADVRGAVVEEVQSYTNISNFQKKLKVWLFNKSVKMLKEADGISVVSQKLKEYLADKYDLRENVSVNTCIAGQKFVFNELEREIIRKRLSLTNKEILVVFSTGAKNPWQKSDYILETLSKLPIKILFLGENNFVKENVITIKAAFSDVPNYLSAADVAVIYRENDVINNVAAPIKFSEYIACGLPVISNKSVAQIEDIINENSVCGKIVSNFIDLKKEDFEELLINNRKEIEKIAIRLFSIESIGNSYLKTYQKCFSS